ncbi:ATP-binding cassette domain-containing protein [bacterium]|nr:ATP-binding cassette domain-containing protein [bacterium]
MSNAIEVSHLTKKYAKSTVNAVDNISFSVKEGEFFAFLGPNGAGKTTAISVLTTTLSKSSGDVRVAGFDVSKEASRVRQNIGIIFQNPSLDQNLTAEENIRFHAVLYGLYPFRPFFSWMPEDYKSKVRELTELIGLGDSLKKPVKTFSGGMKRKLEIIRSLIHNPRVLFLDEPTTGLDPASRKSLWQYILQVRKNEGTTIFLTTHYLEEAEDADRVIVINKGKISADGTPKELKQDLIKNYVRLTPKTLSTLVKELDSKKIKYLVEGIRVKIQISDPGADVQRLIKSIDSPLVDIDIHSPTLNDAYLQLITDKNES